MHRPKVWAGASFDHRRQISLRDDCLETDRHIDHRSLRSFQPQIVGQLRRNQFGTLRLFVHLPPAKLHHDFKVSVAVVFTSKQKWKIPAASGRQYLAFKTAESCDPAPAA